MSDDQVSAGDRANRPASREGEGLEQPSPSPSQGAVELLSELADMRVRLAALHDAALEIRDSAWHYEKLLRGLGHVHIAVVVARRLESLDAAIADAEEVLH